MLHIKVLLKNGEVYSFGLGEGGQLGHGNRENCYVPTLVQCLKKYKIKKIGCGFWFSMAYFENEGLSILKKRKSNVSLTFLFL